MDQSTPDIYVQDEYRVTFGVKYQRDNGQKLHPQAPETLDGQGYVAIIAPDYGTARRAAMGMFGQKWAFLYRPGDYPDSASTPLGEIGRITINFPLEERDATTEYHPV